MSYSKQLFSKDGVSVGVSEAGAVASLSIGISASAGGGEIAGVASVSGSISAQVSVKELIDVGFGLAASKFPSIAAELAAAQALVDAEMAKI